MKLTKHAPAYVSKVLVQHKLRDEKALSALRKSIDSNADWQKALRFADAQQKQTYTAYAKTINDNEAYDREQARIVEEKKKKEDKYNAAVTAMNSQVWHTAVVAFHALDDYKESEAYLRKCIDAYRQQLTAKEGKTDPALAAANEKVAQVQRTLDRAQAAINDAEKGKIEVEKREQTIPEEIHRLSSELSQVHGLFSGGKKRELEGKIDALKREQASTAQRKQEYEQTISKAKAEVTAAEAVLTEAKATHERINTELQKKESTRWTDEAIIAAAAAREPFTKVGNIVTYGHYEQDNNTGNGKEAIEWIVIKYDSTTGRSLLLSRYGLDAHRFDASSYQGWDRSEMRSWLNSTFLSNAFTAKEQAGIATTTVKTGNNAEWVAFAKKKGWSSTSLSGGADTQDKVFLLSLEEAMEYGGYSSMENFHNNGSDKMKAIPTKYAIAQGASQSYSDKLNGTGCCWWWLRSPGDGSDLASRVSSGGSLLDFDVNFTYGSVRPAFWLNLDSADIY